MQTVTLQEAQLHLAAIIEKLTPGEEVIIVRDSRPVARLVGAAKPPERKPRPLGTLKGTVLYMAPDFDAIPAGPTEGLHGGVLAPGIQGDLRSGVPAGSGDPRRAMTLKRSQSRRTP